MPVRSGDRLFGAFAVQCAELERTALDGAHVLSDNLAVRLENVSLFAHMFALKAELEESRRLVGLGAFAAAVAHDIRTPLTSVRLNVQMLRTARSSDEAKECIDTALAELDRLDRSTASILSYSRPVTMHGAAVSLRAVLEDIAKQMKPILAKRDIRLQCEMAGALPRVTADAEQIRQVFINLIDNAANASAEGNHVTLTTRVEENGWAAVQVADEGQGIAPENLPHIFEPFFTTRQNGTGLGLAIVQKIVRAHGGELRVESEPGRGARFTVLLAP